MKTRTLVVKDADDNRQILRSLLTNASFEPLEAADGAAGCAAYVAKPSSPHARLAPIREYLA